MTLALVSMRIEGEDDVTAVRQRARRLSEHLGFGVQDQTRIATAVSEIARNAYGYAKGGRVEFGLDGTEGAQSLVVRVADQGPGIADPDAILEGRYRSGTGLGLGLIGARRLMDRFDLDTGPDRGTRVTLAKRLPPDAPALTAPQAAAMVEAVVRAQPDDPHTALREQNQALLRSLAEIAEREEEAQRLNAELAETNRGVVALYAELEAQAGQLREAGATLEVQVAARTAELAEANARLRAEAAERERMEEDLRQSQKMEAVGQLTGGIAHDFNNLLTGIVGSLDLMQSRMAQGRHENLQRYIEAAMSSANRAAALTHRLLAFARRQPLDPRATDANALIVGMSDLLRRTISESIDLRIETEPGLWLTLCDPHQLENAILNLAINARDAMPDGGTLSIRTGNAHWDGAEPGKSAAGKSASGKSTSSGKAVAGKSGDLSEYVSIRVADTGTGMTPEVIARAFDPFFTTKPLGQGTGLGLSMIYGFARQSDGHTRIESVVGQGTAITLYLPRHRGALDETAPDAAAAARPRGDGQTVMVVEDEPVVRDVIMEVLHDLGYRAIQAVDGPSGLHALAVAGRIDLLVTDVGLPGLNGRQLADQARLTRPDLKVLFITGYAESAAVAAGFLDPGMAMITKPFSVDTLMTRIQAMIRDPVG